jgi:hypothetical protein
MVIQTRSRSSEKPTKPTAGVSKATKGNLGSERKNPKKRITSPPSDVLVAKGSQSDIQMMKEAQVFLFSSLQTVFVNKSLDYFF